MQYLKKHTIFEAVWLKIIRIDFDDIWQTYSVYSRIEFACFSFHVDFFVNFSLYVVCSYE